MNTQKRRQRQIKALEKLQKDYAALLSQEKSENWPDWRVNTYNHERSRMEQEISILERRLFILR